MLNKSLVYFGLFLFSTGCLAQSPQASIPENAWGSPSSWYCVDGFKRVGNECVAIDIPDNAWAYADRWYCNTGFIRSGDSCLLPNQAPKLSGVSISEQFTVVEPRRMGDASLGVQGAKVSNQAESVNSAQQNSSSARLGCAENGSCYGDISAATGRPKTVTVEGYFRADGTYVRGHYRSKPR